MWEEFGTDPRVDVRGFVSDLEIDEICRSADVFLNVRDPQIGDNILNYPSKVPQYLAWGKPVVSTWIDSFSPDFRNVLDVCDNTPEGFVQVLNTVLDRGMNEKLMKYNVIREWFTKNKSWNVQAGRLVDFIRGLPTIN
jgi:glycosyltransferase involved in cell wall biosynthesis